jgi:hypothetical protein
MLYYLQQQNRIGTAQRSAEGTRRQPGAFVVSGAKSLQRSEAGFFSCQRRRILPSSRSNRTYYRGPDAVVTDRFFVWHTTPTKSFVVRDLRNVGFVRSETDQFRPYTAYSAVGALILAVTMWTMVKSPAYALGILTVAIPSLFAVVSMRTRPRRWELRATYRGARVVLYASSDVRVFNQVTRALRRAVEDARPPQGNYDLAAA